MHLLVIKPILHFFTFLVTKGNMHGYIEYIGDEFDVVQNASHKEYAKDVP